MKSGIFVSNSSTRWEAIMRLASRGIDAKDLNLKSFQTCYKVHSLSGLDRGFQYSTTQRRCSMKRMLKRAKDKLKGASAKVAVAGTAVASTATNTFAADPQWFTDATTQMTAIGVMAGVALGGVITVKLIPLAWKYIAPIFSRG